MPSRGSIRTLASACGILTMIAALGPALASAEQAAAVEFVSPQNLQTVLGVAEIVLEVRVPAGQRADRVETVYRDGMNALRAGDTQGAQNAYEALQQVYDRLRQEDVLQIVSRPGVPSGVWRHPVNNPSGRNYYLIVEAVTPDGKSLALPITSEEDGQTRMVSLWGMRVDGRVYDAVARDKQEDGIVNRNRFGVKKRGYLTPEYAVPTTGGAITEW